MVLPVTEVNRASSAGGDAAAEISSSNGGHTNAAVASVVCEERTDDELSVSDLGLRGAREGSVSGFSTDDDLDDVPVEPVRAHAAMASVMRWRESHLVVADFDFAYEFESFQEMYAAAGRAVASEWSRVRCVVQPSVLADPVQAAVVLPSLASVRAVDAARRSQRPSGDGRKQAEEPARRELNTALQSSYEHTRC